MMGNTALPYSMREFSQILTRSGEVYRQQKNASDAVQRIEHLVRQEMRGQIHYSRTGRHAGKWQWRVNNQRVIEVEMASSGQMEAWPLVFAAQSIFRLEETDRPLYLHIEEPEAHLHPKAQIAIAKLIAYLVNQGLKTVITTHLLTTLYALNNLSLAYQKLGPIETRERVPSPEIRLPPETISAYLFDGTQPQKIVDGNGQIDEGRLGAVLGELEAEFNRIATYKMLWE